MPSERWRPIKGYAGYEVSDKGQVRSRDRVACDGRKWKGRVLKPGGGKYHTVGLSNRSVTDAYVHRLVLETFRGPCPSGYEACHNNGDKHDNRLDNLRWDTRKANAADTTVHGHRRAPRGEKHRCAKLTADVVRKIRAAGRAVSCVQWAEVLRVHPTTVDAARRGITWAHVR